MRIAVGGKGGAGKTTLCATLARLAARRGRSVVAIDGDTNPNLAAAPGDGGSKGRVDPLPATLVSRRLGGGPALTAPVDEVLVNHAEIVADGVALLHLGAPDHPDEGCLCSAHATVSALLADLGSLGDTVTFLDLEASPEHLSRGTARHADVLVLVAEPYFRSLKAIRLQASLASETAIEHVVVVANKCRTDLDREAIAEFCQRHQLELIGTVPWSEAVLEADATNVALLDHDPHGPVVGAIDAIGSALLGLTVGQAEEVRA